MLNVSCLTLHGVREPLRSVSSFYGFDTTQWPQALWSGSRSSISAGKAFQIREPRVVEIHPHNSLASAARAKYVSGPAI